MGTPQVNCMSKLPTAHEPAERRRDPLGTGPRPGGGGGVAGGIATAALSQRSAVAGHAYRSDEK
jgi:hypothetical protein